MRAQAPAGSGDQLALGLPFSTNQCFLNLIFTRRPASTPKY